MCSLEQRTGFLRSGLSGTLVGHEHRSPSRLAWHCSARGQRAEMVVALRVIGVVILVVVAMSYLFSRLMTNPPRRRGTWPLDFPAKCSPERIASFDGTELSATFVSVEDAKGTVVMVHGLGDCKEFYADRAQFLAGSGYGVLLLDLRAHGRSGGRHCTMGYKESKDILAAIRFLRERGWGQRAVCLWGVSLGATASLLAAAEDPTVDGIIAESPFVSLEETVSHHARLVSGLPNFPLVHLLLLMTRLRTGVRASQIDLASVLNKLDDVPVLFIGGMADRRMPPETIRKLCDAKRGKKSLWLVPDAAHAEAYSVAEEEYEDRVLDFLAKVRGGEGNGIG